MSAAIGLIAAGSAVKTDDKDLPDAVFLWRRGMWTWESLQSTPERVLRIIQKLDGARPKASSSHGPTS